MGLMSFVSRWRIDSASLKFGAIFFALVVVLTLLIQIPWIDDHIIGPYIRILASIGGGIIGLYESDVSTAGSVIRKGAFAVDIKRGCDGVVASILLIAACLAYPFSWRSRALGTLFGYALIFTLNMVRIVGLFLIGLHGSSETFEFFHVYVSQFAVIAITMVFWIFWAGREQPVLEG